MVSAIAGIDGRTFFVVRVLTNSVARCWASARSHRCRRSGSCRRRAATTTRIAAAETMSSRHASLDEPRCRRCAQVGLADERPPVAASASIVMPAPRDGWRRPDLVAAVSPHPVGRRTSNGANWPPSVSSSGRTVLRGLGRAGEQQVAAAARAADLAARGARRLRASTASPRSGCARRCAGSSASSRPNASRSIAPSSLDVAGLDHVAHRVRHLLASCFMPSIVSSRPSRYSSIWVSIRPTLRRT